MVAGFLYSKSQAIDGGSTWDLSNQKEEFCMGFTSYEGEY